MFLICQYSESMYCMIRNNNLDIIAIVVSVISLLLSIVFCILNDYRTKQLNRINIASEYFNTVYKDKLIKEIPKKRADLRWEKGKLLNYAELCVEITALADDSGFYYYSKSAYYSELKSLVQSAEDCICGTANRTEATTSGQERALNEIDKKIKNIYHCISKGLNGSEFK